MSQPRRPYKPRERNIDLTGQKFERWTVLRKSDIPVHGRVAWVCLCECGVERAVSQANLRGNLSKSCRCLANDRASETRTTHGRSRTPIYSVWLNMKSRCRNPNHTDYYNYGGRGIKVCDQWYDSFESFFADVGELPSSEHTIDRINVDGHYEPGNVRWATRLEQNNNCRNSRQVTHDGETKSINAWAKQYGFNSGALYYRIVTKGMTLAEAIAIPAAAAPTE